MNIKAMVLSLSLVSMPFFAFAEDGKSLYDSKCSVCHAGGIAGAPVLGDSQAWKDRIAKGMDALYQSSINGIGAMPPKGGAGDVSDDDIKLAVDYMVSQAE